MDTEECPFHYIGGRRILNEGIITDDVLDWSTNLLGGKFKTEDAFWRQKGKGTTPWKDKDGNVNLCHYNGCYEQTTSKHCAFITVKCLHNKEIPYKRVFGNKKDLEQYAEKTHDVTKEALEQWHTDAEPECHATITIEHKPIVLNYWHMTIEITPKDFANPIPRDSKKNKSIKKRVKEALHLHIIKNIICEEPYQMEEIHKELYVNP